MPGCAGLLKNSAGVVCAAAGGLGCCWTQPVAGMAVKT